MAVMSKEMRLCEVCGKKFLSSHKKHSICSDKCRAKKYAEIQLQKYRKKNHQPFIEIIYKKQDAYQRECPVCGTLFETFDESKEFCSLDCRKADALHMDLNEYKEHKASNGKVEEAIEYNKDSLLVAYIIYECYDCKQITQVNIEEGIEVGIDSKPSPFELFCPHCHGIMRETDSWRPLKEFRRNKIGEKYLATLPEGDKAVYVYKAK